VNSEIAILHLVLLFLLLYLREDGSAAAAAAASTGCPAGSIRQGGRVVPRGLSLSCNASYRANAASHRVRKGYVHVCADDEAD